MNALSDCRIAQERLLHDRDFRRVDLLQGKDVDHAAVDEGYQANDCEGVFEEADHWKITARTISTKSSVAAVFSSMSLKVSPVFMALRMTVILPRVKGF